MHAHRLALALALAACSNPPPSRARPGPEAAAPPAVVHDAGPEIPPRLRDWAEAWAALRGCMVGTPPQAADLVEAQLAHELLRGVDRCAAGYALVEQLARDAAADPGSSQAWEAVLAAVEAMVSDYRDGETGARVLDASAMTSVDDATAAVYRAYDLVAPVPATGPSLPTLSPGTPISVTAGLTTRAMATVDHVIGAWVAKWSEGQGVLQVRSPDDFTYRPFDEPLPAGTWTAERRGNKVIAGLTNRKGEIGRSATTVMKGRDLDVVTTLGTGEARAVVVTRDVGDDGFVRGWIVVSSDGGASWKPPVALAEGGDAMVGGGDDEVQVFWIGADGLSRRQRITDPAVLPAPRVLGRSMGGGSCSSGEAMWWTAPDNGTLHHLAPDGTVFDLPLSGPLRIEACSVDGVVVSTSDGAVACSATGCGSPAKHGGDRSFVDVSAPGEMVEAAQRGSVVAVWEAGAPRLFRVGAATLIAVVRWGERTYLGLETADGLSFTPLP